MTYFVMLNRAAVSIHFDIHSSAVHWTNCHFQLVINTPDENGELSVISSSLLVSNAPGQSFPSLDRTCNPLEINFLMIEMCFYFCVSSLASYLAKLLGSAVCDPTSNRKVFPCFISFKC